MLSIYRASAGSGKTFALARDYIRLLLGIQDVERGACVLNFDPASGSLKIPDKHRYILAITFTRKATEEMKTRIINELNAMSRLDAKSAYRDYFRDELKWPPEHQAKGAELALRQLLFDYHNFNVTTIDAFFQRVLHTFARELDRQCDYEVELSTENALKTAVGDMLDDFNSLHSSGDPKAKSFEDWVYGYMADRVSQDKRANFFDRSSKQHRDLVREMATIEKESFAPYADDMRQYLRSGKLPLFVKDIDDCMRASVRGVCAMAAEADAASLIDSMKSNSVCRKLAAAVCAIASRAPGAPVSASEISALASLSMSDSVGKFLSGEGQSPFLKKFETEAGRELLRDLLGRCRRMASIVVGPLSKIKKSLSFLGLLAYVWDYLDASARENNMVLISETNRLVHDIIDNEDTPFIYERMGNRLDHFLIDEFQDTSVMQWSNLYPLISNSLGYGFDNLVIGDEKQSIYRFRNSDASILHEKVGEMFDEYIDKEADSRRANVNYRSADQVVGFNNHIFLRLSEEFAVDSYENVEQQLPERDAPYPGYVRFERIDHDGGSVADYREEAMERMAQAIMRQHAEGGYPWREIAVLVNRREEARQVVAFLLDRYAGKIDVLSDEALLVSSSSAVKLVMSVIKIIDSMGSLAPSKHKFYLDEEHTGVLLQRYQYLFNRAIARAKAEGCADIGGDRVKALAHEIMREALNEDADAAADAVMELQRMRPSSLVAQVEFVIGRMVSEADRAEQMAYLAALQDAVLDFASRGNGSIHAFVQWWDANADTLSISGAEEADAVRVMTVHASKGLEFGCVHIPFCIWKMHGQRASSLWVETPEIPGLRRDNAPKVLYMQLDESFSHEESPFYRDYHKEEQASVTDTINMTYVAFTRACSELRVWYHPSGSDNIGGVLDRMLSTSDIMEPDGDDAYKMGEPTAFRPKAKAEKYERGARIDMTYPVNPAERANAVLQVADALSGEENIAESDMYGIADEEPDEELREQGVKLHALMSGIKAASDLGRAVSRLAPRLGIADADAKAYSAIIDAHLRQAAAEGHAWYAQGARCYIERPIVVPNLNIQRRPDRVVANADGTIDVIDYKFTPDAAREGCDEHKAQVREYMGLMRDMGHRRVRGFLCYPLLEKILEVRQEQ